LPRRLDRIADTVEHGELTGRVSCSPTRVLLASGGGPQLPPTLTLFQVFGYCLLVVGVVLALRVLILIFQRE
jgi:hypothetical protein